MKTQWDYTNLAKAYLKRPNYSGTAIDAILKLADMTAGKRICDIGAGVAHLTLELLSRRFLVMAIEPNDAMRILGERRTEHLSTVEWQEGTGEDTRQSSNKFDMVTFGSSFNVCDPQCALKETARILKPCGWLVCLYNNRELNDPIQSNIESIIRRYLPDYNYGSRRDDHSQAIDQSDMFGPVVQISSKILHTQKIEDCVEAWRSHATLERQAGLNFDLIIKKIEEYLISLHCNEIKIPYRTNVWLSQKNE